VVLTTWLLPPTPTHSGVVRHETPVRKPVSPHGGWVSTAVGAPQVIGPLAAEAAAGANVITSAISEMTIATRRCTTLYCLLSRRSRDETEI
jgi:hypothetical protein